jgi:hypothetical protein
MHHHRLEVFQPGSRAVRMLSKLAWAEGGNCLSAVACPEEKSLHSVEKPDNQQNKVTFT